jgi:histidine triad (HIT) family protein
METNAQDNCIFCSIANKKVASNILHESDNVIVIKDIMPKAPVHVQVMPKRHIQSVNELTDADAALIAEMILAAKSYALEAGIAETGFKLVLNTGKEGGQIIQHLHMHVLGGKQLEE